MLEMEMTFVHKTLHQGIERAATETQRKVCVCVGGGGGGLT